MSVSDYLVAPHEQVSFLRGLTRSARGAWLLNYLRYGHSAPLVLPDHGMERAEDLAGICDLDATDDLADKLGEAANQILGRYGPDRQEALVVIGAAKVIAHTGYRPGARRVRHLVKCGAFLDTYLNPRGAVVETHDWPAPDGLASVHRTLLRVLMGLDRSFDTRFLACREAMDPRYADVVFRGLWDSERGDGIRQALRLLPILLDHRRATAHFHPGPSLVEFLACLKGDRDQHVVPLLFYAAGPERLDVLLEVLDGIGISVVPDDENQLVCVEGSLLRSSRFSYHVFPFPGDETWAGSDRPNLKSEIERTLKSERECLELIFGDRYVREMREMRLSFGGRRAAYREALVAWGRDIYRKAQSNESVARERLDASLRDSLQPAA